MTDYVLTSLGDISMIDAFIHAIAANVFLQAAALWIVFDTFLGCIRAALQHEFNSSFGINGGIRKAAMLISLVFLLCFDVLVEFNLIAFIPQDIRAAMGLQKVGTGEFFAILYFLYESLSILKNMYRIGIPMPKWLKSKIEGFLKDMTGEMKSI